MGKSDDRKSKKEKKERKAARKMQEGEAIVETAAMAKAESQSIVPEGISKRAPLGSPAFVSQWEALRDANMKKDSKKDNERKSAKNDLKSALETCMKLSQKGLKMCGTSAATYLLEHMTADYEKLKIHIAQDEDYMEELRFKHNKLSDLLDETRNFTPQQLQKDLVRNREIREKCSQLVRGDAKEEILVDPEELLELVKVRNSIRLWFGGANMAKGSSMKVQDADEKELFSTLNSEIRVKPVKEDNTFQMPVS